jgi:hypothetical protein
MCQLAVDAEDPVSEGGESLKYSESECEEACAPLVGIGGISSAPGTGGCEKDQEESLCSTTDGGLSDLEPESFSHSSDVALSGAVPDSAFRGCSAPSTPLPARLAGCWIQNCGDVVCIADGQVHWPCDVEPDGISVRSEGAIAIAIYGQLFTAEVSSDCSVLAWSDGDVWRRAPVNRATGPRHPDAALGADRAMHEASSVRPAASAYSRQPHA